MFRNERLSFQIAYRYIGDPAGNIQRHAPIKVGGALASYATLRLVANVPNQYPTYAVNPGGAFLRTEPGLKVLEQYKKCMNVLKPLLEDYTIIDALSSFDFYSMGIIDTPVPSTYHAEPFIKANLKNPWVYYCGGGRMGTSDRSISMPSARTRILGVQLYYYNIVGFLHWGYNFYNCCKSYSVLDPYGNPDGFYFTPSGDCFLVYPGENGTAWESLRLNAMREAMDDIRALRLYEEKFGREAAVTLLMEGTNGKMTFTEYPSDADYLLNLREKIAKSFM